MLLEEHDDLGLLTPVQIHGETLRGDSATETGNCVHISTEILAVVTDMPA